VGSADPEIPSPRKSCRVDPARATLQG
jgi:hypothetical protein